MAFCGKCGTQLHENATFCANCGTSVGAPAAPTQPAGGTSATPPPYTPPYASQPMYVPAPPPPPQDSFGAMFDVTFQRSAGMSLVKILFVVMIIVVVAAAAFIIYITQDQRTLDPLVAFIVIPLIVLLYIMQTRLVMEVCAAVLRMEKHLAEMMKQRR